MSYKDREINFMAIAPAADTANAADTETSVDLSNFGVNMANGMALRVFKVEYDRAIDDRWLSAGAADGYVNLSVRTITSGTTPPVLTDDGVISVGRLDADWMTTVGMTMVLDPFVKGGVFPEGLLIASDRLYLYFDNNSGAAIRAFARIWYKLEHVSGSDWRELWEVWRRA